MRKQIRRQLNIIRTISRSLTIKLFSPLFRKISKRLYLSYDAESVADGVGAQVQRVIATAGLASYFNTNYEHSLIQDITTHPMDSFQEPSQRFDFVRRLNSHIIPTIYCTKSPANCEVSRIPVLKLNVFLLKILKTFLLRRNLLILTTEVYAIVDSCPEIYKFHRKFLDIDFGSKIHPSPSSEVCLHYRRGVGGMALYHNQIIPRELSLDYYLLGLQQLIRVETFSNLKILTDSPLSDMVYEINEDQITLWEKTPGFFDGALYIKGMDLNVAFQKLNLELEVIVGGDPIASLGILQNAKTLIMSKSSFSYVAALLNTDGQIYFPTDFWHPKLKHWKTFK